MRTCIFCGNPVNSKEDVWPQWLIRRFGNNKKGIVEGQRGKLPPDSWKAGRFPLRTGNVCKVGCNNGWMSDLENRVKPIMERFFHSEQVSLDQHDQTTLAIWICKNAMVYETLRHGSPMFFTSQEHKLFRKSSQLPLNTTIWIAKSVGFADLFFTASDLSGIANEPFHQVKAYVTTMCFGPIAIQILNAKMSKSTPQNITITGNLQPGPWDQIIIQIWPIADEVVLWPNKVGLNGELGLETFAKRWSPTEEPLNINQD